MIQLHLNPGGFYFGGGQVLLKTVLGSCIAVTLWNPARRLGGMCHVVLPSNGSAPCHDRYGNCAVRHFLDEIEQAGTRPRDYIAAVIGGGSMFPVAGAGPFTGVGERNKTEVMRRMAQVGFRIARLQVGGAVCRRVALSLQTGDLVVEETPIGQVQ